LVAFLVFGHYTRNAHVSGVLVPDTEWLQLASAKAARVLEVHASEGQIVRQGDLLLVLTPDRLAADAGEAERILIRAPQDGVLSALLAMPGQGVASGATVARLAPTPARLQAQLFAPASVLGFLRPEQTLRLRYQAFPYQRFGHYPGQVLQVARTPLQATEIAGPSASSTVARAGPGGFAGVPTGSEPLYRVIVALDQQAVSGGGQTLPLAAGMRLEADVPLDRRRLIEWLFEPVLSRASGG
jgi:membrane fusion protein